MSTDEEFVMNMRRRVGGNLRRLRKGRGMSQANLAEKADLNRSYLSMVENGRRNISLDNLVWLALALEVELVDLLDKAGEPAMAAE